MSQYSETKINKILQHLPKNAVATTKWLGAFGVGSDLLNRYKKSRWFTEVGYGAVLRTGDKPHWAGALYALQEQLRLPVHLGGKSAIGYQGYAHYIPLNKRESVALFCPYKTSIPKWFEKYDWQAEINVTSTNLFPPEFHDGLKTLEISGFTLQCATLERALLEILSHIPMHQSLDEARKIMEGMMTLDPAITQNLLQKCGSIKAKRLFLYLAEKENHAWFRKLDIEKIDIGTGNRVVVNGGVVDKKYKITVPRNWYQEDEMY